jgi:hypothetical protein
VSYGVRVVSVSPLSPNVVGMLNSSLVDIKIVDINMMSSPGFSLRFREPEVL